MNPWEQSAVDQARKELDEEYFRECVTSAKEKLRQKKRSIWDRIFPFRIVLIRKNKESK